MKNFKIRQIAYFFGSILLMMTFVNFFVVNSIAIHPKETQIIGYTLQIREIANQLKLTLTILANQEFYNENLADDIKRLEGSYNTKLSVLENSGEFKIESNGQVLHIPKPDEPTRILLSKIRAQWVNYGKDVDLVIDKLTKGASTDTLKLDEKWVVDKYNLFVSLHDNLTALYQEKLERQYANLNLAFILLGIFNLAIIASIYYTVRNLILIPIQQISMTSRQLAKGNLSKKIRFTSQNEIGYIAQNINDLAEIVEKATDFSKEIGQGNLDAEYKGDASILENKGSIVAALQLMRDQLREIALKDQQERWLSAGIAEFSEMLRNLDTKNINEMCYHIINFIVRYMEANQGLMFVLNDDIPNLNEHYLEAMAGYAANKRKIFNQKIKIGEGLVGQSFVDKETILLDEVPSSYEKVSSALGMATPRNVLIVPFTFHDVALGVLEILSLKVIPQYKVTFVEKIAEIFSSTVSTAKAYNKSQKLFAESLEVEKRISRRG
ncbi:MAG: HAMP domain-containing protein [Raineya sp.]|jgi:HAMP domain-containing protein|nr:HAMP domain-containing protein [Raineya sp.]